MRLIPAVIPVVLLQLVLASTPLFAAPVVTNISPATVRPGAVVTLTGSGFTGATGTPLRFNGSADGTGGLAAAVNVTDDTSLTATVPLGAVSGPISVTVSSVTGLSTDRLTIAPDWQVRNPSLSADALVGVAKGDDGAAHVTYVAVGSAGDILTSTPDVDHWVRSYSNGSSSTGALTAVIFNSSPHLFVAVGSGGLIVTSPDGSTWTARSAGSANYRSVAYGNGLFVAVSSTTTVATSADGITWSTNTSGTANSNAIGFGNGVFVAVGNTGAIRTSTNGTSWLSPTSGTANQLNGVAWVNSQYVAVGNNSTITTSPDGATWTVQTSTPNTSTTLRAIAYGNGEYAAVGVVGTLPAVFTSDNGTRWVGLSSIFTEWRTVIFDGTQFVGGGFSGEIATSVDGVNWSLHKTVSVINYVDAVYGGGIYLAVSSNGASTYVTSADGTTWTPYQLSPGGGIVFNDVAFGFGNFVAVGNSVIFTTGSYELFNNPSNAGWENTVPGGSPNLQAVAFGSGAFVTVGNAGVAFRSIDDDIGYQWASVSSGTANNLLGVGYGSTGVFTGFVAVGANGTLITSPDGTTWTTRTSGTVNQLNGVTFNGSKCVVVGANSTVLSSTDGITWTTQALGTASVNLTDVAAGDGLFVATNLTNANLLYVSTDAITWASSNPTLHQLNQSTIAGIGYGNGRFVVTSGNGVLVTSNPAADTLAITTQPSSQTFVSGNTVSFNVTATGTGVHYQWYREPLQNHLYDTSIPVGTDSSSFTTPALSTSGGYWVRVTDGAGNSVDSATAAALGPPRITDNPESETLTAGGSTVLEGFAFGSGTLTFQWQKDGVDIVGATDSTLTLSNAQAANAGSYTVIISNGNGAPATSQAAVITVTPQAPVIASGTVPGTRLATAGQSFPLITGYVIATINGLGTSIPGITGTEPFTYQWKKDNVNLVNGGSISGATTAILSFSNVQPSDAGTYSLVVTNSVGTATSGNGVLTVVPEQPYNFTALAGLSNRDSTDATGTNARFAGSQGMALDPDGVTIYIADTSNHVIRKFNTSTGVVTTLAGKAGILGSADGVGDLARFNNPSGLAVDAAHNVYVVDNFNATIRKVTSGGTVTTLAGIAGVFGLADGVGAAARFNRMNGIAIDGAGNLYLADLTNSSIRTINIATGAVSTLAGFPGVTGDVDGTGTSARFTRPFGLVRDSANGNLFVTDNSTGVIRKVTSSGVVTTVAGMASSRGGGVGLTDGIGGAARFNGLQHLAMDSAKNLYAVDSSNSTIRKITPSGVVTTFAGLAQSAGSADGTGSVARFNSPSGVIIDGNDNLYVTDAGNNTIRKITPAGVVTTVAGLAPRASNYDGTGTGAQFGAANDVAVDSLGNAYVPDATNHIIRKITPAGVTTTLAGLAGTSGNTNGAGNDPTTARFNNPRGIAIDLSDNLYVADSGNHTIRKITPAGVVSTLAGLAGTSGTSNSTDGTGATARFNAPRGVTVDLTGNVYVADQTNHAIRKITPSGATSTLAGSTTATSGFADATGTAARFNNPWKVAVDLSGNVWVADRSNNRLRKVTSTGVVTTALQTPALPLGVAADRNGNVYVCFAASIFKYYPLTGAIRLLGGGFPELGVGSTDGLGTVARWWETDGITINAGGRIYISDVAGNTIRTGITPASLTFPTIATKTFGDGPFAPGATSSAGLLVSYSVVSGPATTSNGLITLTGPGSVTVRAAQEGNDVYYLERTFTVLNGAAKSTDFNGDGKSDLLWQNRVTGDRYTWLMNGTALTSSVFIGNNTSQWVIGATGDFNADGKADLIWQNTANGDCYIWLMNGSALISSVYLGNNGVSWHVVGTGDFNADGQPDLIWQNTTSGDAYAWLMNGTALTSSVFIGTNGPLWTIVGVGDFNSDNRADLIWQNFSSGDCYVWLMNGTALSSSVFVANNGAQWQVTGSGDYNSDGKSDLIWTNTITGERVIWMMNGTAVGSSTSLGVTSLDWSLGRAVTGGGQTAADFNSDTKSDLIWQNTSDGDSYIWLMNGTSLLSSVFLGNNGIAWQIAASGDFNSDGKADLVWQNALNGDRYIWLMNGTAVASSVFLGTVAPDWDIAAIGDFNGDGKSDLVWQNTVNGDRYIWLMNGTVVSSSIFLGNTGPDWQIAAVGDYNADGKSDLVWQNSANGDCYVWLMNGTSLLSSVFLGTNGTQWQIAGSGDFNADGKSDLIWQNTSNGDRYIWLMNGTSLTSSVFIGTTAPSWKIKN
ncbi:MAG: FG-GAP-like repeat-containing protein [Opitutus sp.]